MEKIAYKEQLILQRVLWTAYPRMTKVLALMRIVLELLINPLSFQMARWW
jgi:hypothetical protein